MTPTPLPSAQSGRKPADWPLRQAATGCRMAPPAQRKGPRRGGRQRAQQELSTEERSLSEKSTTARATLQHQGAK